MKTEQKVYSYRWAVLAVFMAITMAVEIQWLTHAPVARAASAFYLGQFNPESLINIDFLAMVYMLVFLVVCFPASYIIDTWGIRPGLLIGAILAGISAVVKAVFAASFPMVLAAQIGLAVAQPFILNAVTAVSVRWFPLNERGLAAGLSALAQYLGIIAAMIFTPLMIETAPDSPLFGFGFERMLLVYGVFTLAAALAVVIVIKERPPVPPSSEEYVRNPFLKGLGTIFRKRSMVITIFLFLIGLGLFNAVSSMVDALAARLGIGDSGGDLGAFMLGGGIIGALVLPALSDKFQKRKFFLVICMIGVLPGVAGLTFAADIAGSARATEFIALASSGILGFFIMSAGPIGFQYAAEISVPAPESTSQGILLLAGQISGLIFVAGMTAGNYKFLSLFMILFVAFSVVNIPLVLRLKESEAAGHLK